MKVMELAKKFRVSRHRIYEIVYKLETLKGIEVKRNGRNLQLTDDLIQQIEEYLEQRKKGGKPCCSHNKKGAGHQPAPHKQLKNSSNH
ncbi:MAG: hypothetical protein J7L34_08710 [Thermotogaceae bacterium]|nr:hypothetical protein [Thermotogaceae bacterium]